MITVQFDTPALVRSGDTLTVRFADGNSLEFQGAEGLQDFVHSQGPNVDALRAMSIANRLARDPLLDSPDQWDGKAVTLDLENPNPAQVFKVA